VSSACESSSHVDSVAGVERDPDQAVKFARYAAWPPPTGRRVDGNLGADGAGVPLWKMCGRRWRDQRLGRILRKGPLD
jgi:hypothetical protein